MKTDRHGQAKILTSDEIKRLFEDGFTCDRDRALFGICLYTAGRINEACTLLSTDVYDANGVRAKITIRKGRKGSKTRARSRLIQRWLLTSMATNLKARNIYSPVVMGEGTFTPHRRMPFCAHERMSL